MIKRTVIVRPVGHFLHGFHFRTTSHGDITPTVTLFQPLYVPRVQIPFGDMPERHFDGNPHLTVSDPDIGRKLIEHLGGDRLDSLLRIDTPDKFLVWAEHHGKWESHGYSMLTHALAGRRARAIALAEQRMEHNRAFAANGAAWAAVRNKQLGRFIRIFESGQARVNRMLRGFEAINAARIGVERWWHWSPVVE
jgi:hypothetical protein